MGKRDGRQKGAQTHAEGQHGAKAHAHFIESLHEGRAATAAETGTPSAEGGHRLREDREQHDEADKNSERNRLTRDEKRGRIDDRSRRGPGALKGSPPAGK
jgi:hypothetical protein